MTTKALKLRKNEMKYASIQTSIESAQKALKVELERRLKSRCNK